MRHFAKTTLLFAVSVYTALFAAAPHAFAAVADNRALKTYDYGESDAMFRLGLKYLNQGDSKTANRYFIHAAADGNACALMALGDSYLSGDGIGSSGTKALISYVLAADKGYGPAQLVLGFILRNGEAGVRDLELSRAYFLKASRWRDQAIADIARVELMKYETKVKP